MAKQRTAPKDDRRGPLSLQPQRSVLKVQGTRVLLLGPDEALATAVGLKASGLLALPEAWVPPFFVIDARACGDAQDLEEGCRLALERNRLGPDLILRSSGVAETLQQRGRLPSEPCTSANLVAAVQRLSQEVGDGETTVHWIVQQAVRPVRKGHLSNERRLSYEARDWLLEVELEGSKPGFTTPIAFRKWRDGDLPDQAPLLCSSEAQISLRSKEITLWARSVGTRLHFEWVWSGSRLWVVQADVAESASGRDPASTLPRNLPRIRHRAVSVFEPASANQMATYGKLRNARLYQELGYEMPEFYVLDEPGAVADILNGTLSVALNQDLSELTKRPFIIRTDGTNIPTAKREMLPRSDELRSEGEAAQWLTGSFRSRIAESGLGSAGLCLIGHHFIPSVASAWARAEPGKSIVRVESLWGVPEGLYWYSHDTFEVDVDRRAYAERLRFKGTFFAADETGHWVPHQTLAPADWRRSVRRTSWLYEIGDTTRKIAEREGRAVSVMWFVDNHSRATRHHVLPWFHNSSDIEGQPKAAPRRKLTFARDYRVECTDDWHRLKAHVAEGKHLERIVVCPRDPELVRNPQFAEELARLAAAHRIVVELAGGILSHAYYVLQRHGAHVECVDLFGADPEVREFNKLVRDKIPASIQGKGEDVEVVALKGDALLAALKQKLVEEAFEALDARSGAELLAELADVQEVVQSLCSALQISLSQLESERQEKARTRGGFEQGVMLRRTSTPHSLSRGTTVQHDGGLVDEEGAAQRPTVVLRAEEIPTSATLRRPDLRTIGELTEKLFAFDAELTRTSDRPTRNSTAFELPIGRDESLSLTLVIEFNRSRGVLRGNVRLRLEPRQLPIRLVDQLELDFPDVEPER